MAKDNLAQTHPITTLKGFSHLAERLSASRQMKKAASLPNNPSTETHNGVKLALRAIQATLYYRFFSTSAH